MAEVHQQGEEADDHGGDGGGEVVDDTRIAETDEAEVHQQGEEADDHGGDGDGEVVDDTRMTTIGGVI